MCGYPYEPHVSSDQEVQEIMNTHLGGELITDGMRQAMIDAMPVRIVFRVRKGHVLTWCSKCGKEGEDETGGHLVKHSTGSVCPVCGAKGVGLNERYIGKRSYDELAHYMYRRSETDPGVLIAMSLWSAQDWRDVNRESGWEPSAIPCRMEVFTLAVIPYGGKAVMYRHDARYGTPIDKGWYKQGRPACLGYMTMDGKRIQRVCHEGMLAEAVRGAKGWGPLLTAVAGTRVIPGEDRWTMLRDCAAHPQYEYMIKAGQPGIVEDQMICQTCGTVNWRRNSPREALKLTADEWGRVKAKGYHLRQMDLLPMQLAGKAGQKMKLEDSMAIARGLKSYAAVDIRQLAGRYGEALGVGKLLRYLTRQNGIHRSVMVQDLIDYYQDCARLGEDIHQSVTAFPRNLLERKAEIAGRVKYEKDLKAKAAVSARRDELEEMYTFRACGLVLSPFESPEEIVQEGVRQGICIGSYVDRYASGETILCKLRRQNEPDKPFHAVEFSAQSGRLVQCRGAHNQTDEADEAIIRAFWVAWDKAKKQKNRIELSIRKNRRLAG